MSIIPFGDTAIESFTRRSDDSDSLQLHDPLGTTKALKAKALLLAPRRMIDKYH